MKRTIGRISLQLTTAVMVTLGFLTTPFTNFAAHAAPLQAAVCPANSKEVSIGIEYLRAPGITDDENNPFEHSDEIYFLVNGVHIKADGSQKEIDLGKRKKTYEIREDRKKKDWYQNVGETWCIRDNERLSVVVTIREDDDLPSPKLVDILVGAAAGIGAAYGIEPLGEVAKDRALKIAKDIVDQLKNDKVDDTVGAFQVTVTNRDGKLAYDWRPVAKTIMTRYGSVKGKHFGKITDDRGATFSMTGSGADYRMNVSNSPRNR